MNNQQSHSSIERYPTRTLDERKKPIVRVPLSDGTQAVVDADTYDQLIAAAVTTKWTINSDGGNRLYVRCRHKGRMVILARLIKSAPPDALISYRSGDRRDLRKANLMVRKLRAKSYDY